jgi:hypothetical protein
LPHRLIEASLVDDGHALRAAHGIIDNEGILFVCAKAVRNLRWVTRRRARLFPVSFDSAVPCRASGTNSKTPTRSRSARQFVVIRLALDNRERLQVEL